MIVDYAGQKIAVGGTLDSALAQIFGPLPWNSATSTAPSTPSTTTTGPSTGPSSAASGLAAQAAQANQLYQQALAALKSGDFSGYAQKIQALGGLLQQMIGAPTSSSTTASSSAGSTTAAGTTASRTSAGSTTSSAAPGGPA